MSAATTDRMIDRSRNRADRRRRRLRTLPAVGAVLALALSACGGYDATPMPTPQASGATSSAAAPGGPACDNTRATASYQPSGALPASTALPRGSTMAAIKQRGKLRAGISADTYLLGSRDPISGQIQGFDIDLVKRIAKAITGDENAVEFRVITAAQRIPVLEEGEVDVVVRAFTINCTRWQDIAFSAEYYRAGQKVLVRKGSDLEKLDTDRALARLRAAKVKVCAPRGTSSLDNMKKHVDEGQLAPQANHTGCLVAFQQGDVDVITGDDTILAGLAAQDPYAVVLPGASFTAEPYGIGVKKGDRAFVQFLNALLEQMNKDGSWTASYNRWLAPTLGKSPGQPKPVYGRAG